MATGGFDSEAFKLMIADISKAQEVRPGIFQIRLSAGDLGIGSRSGSKLLTVKLVWIQGNITEIREEGNENGKVIAINDGTAEAVIAGCDAIPGGDHKDVKKGGYIGILGQICATSPRIYIKAAKIMVLSSKPCLKAIWPDEVKDLKAFLLGLYSSWNENVS